MPTDLCPQDPHENKKKRLGRDLNPGHGSDSPICLACLHANPTSIRPLHYQGTLLNRYVVYLSFLRLWLPRKEIVRIGSDLGFPAEASTTQTVGELDFRVRKGNG